MPANKKTQKPLPQNSNEQDQSIEEQARGIDHNEGQQKGQRSPQEKREEANRDGKKENTEK